jgi:Uma2 family endonuclease
MMATIAPTPVRSPHVRASAEQRITLRGISWETYQRLVEEVGDRSVLKAYNRGVLELMTPGPLHEIYKTLLARLIETVTMELELPCRSLGSTHWDRPEVERGLEPDECYLLTAAKVEAARHRSKKAADYPAPDLAIEIDLSRSEVDRAEIYATIGVPEVWRFDSEALRIDRLRDDGMYEEVAESLFLPVAPAEVVRWLVHVDIADETVWARQLREWVRAEVLPRHRPAGPGGA